MPPILNVQDLTVRNCSKSLFKSWFCLLTPEEFVNNENVRSAALHFPSAISQTIKFVVSLRTFKRLCVISCVILSNFSNVCEDLLNRHDFLKICVDVPCRKSKFWQKQHCQFPDFIFLKLFQLGNKTNSEHYLKTLLFTNTGIIIKQKLVRLTLKQ